MKLLDHWLPPDGSGRPVACLATSFTFDADFFSQDCLARFLRLSDAYGERDEIADLALMLEEEERLSEARVVVLVDRSCNPEPRNLRWDIVPVAVRGGLLHAKVALLVWERATRFLIGSANLTSAGYRRQLEIAMAIDLEAEGVRGDTLIELTEELRLIVRDLTPGDEGEPGPKRRALEILDLVEARIGAATNRKSKDRVTMAFAATRPGASPLDRLADVWRGPSPQSVTALAPFWDTVDPMPGVRAVLQRLARRSSAGVKTSATFVVAVEPVFSGAGVIRAPVALRHAAPGRLSSTVRAVEVSEGDTRRLHAKCVLYESATWLAAMIGSSNITDKGLGTAPLPHRELNLWIGCPADSREAKLLRKLIPLGPEISDDAVWEPASDEDEEAPPALPLGFADAQLVDRATLRLRFDRPQLPQRWRVSLPAGSSVDETMLVDESGFRDAGHPDEVVLALDPDSPLPSGLLVRWTDDGGQFAATWLVNVGDLGLLPPPSELRDLPASVLLAILASTRPLRDAAEQALRTHAKGRSGAEDLDPLKRFDSSGFLLQRVRTASTAFWGLEQRLARPAGSLEALDWRLNGAIGPGALGRRLVEEARAVELAHTVRPEGTGGTASPAIGILAGETQFLLAELAMTVAAVPWSTVASRLEQHAVDAKVEETQALLRTLSSELGGEHDLPPSLREYVAEAFARCAP